MDQSMAKRQVTVHLFTSVIGTAATTAATTTTTTTVATTI